MGAIESLLQQGDMKKWLQNYRKMIWLYMFRNRNKDKYICPLICHQYVLHINEFIFFETITVHVHGLLCGEIQISGEFEYKHYRGAIKGFSGFQNKFDCKHRA